MSEIDKKMAEQKQMVRDISTTMLAISKQSIMGYIDLEKLTTPEGISLMADIATEVYMQSLSDLAYISRGRDKITKAFIKDNNSKAKRKALALYGVKAEERDLSYQKAATNKTRLHTV